MNEGAALAVTFAALAMVGWVFNHGYRLRRLEQREEAIRDYLGVEYGRTLSAGLDWVDDTPRTGRFDKLANDVLGYKWEPQDFVARGHKWVRISPETFGEPVAPAKKAADWKKMSRGAK